MALYYNLVFVVLAVEMALFSILSLPLPSNIRRPLLKAMSLPFASQQIQITIKCVFGFTLILFLDAFNRMLKVTEELNKFQGGLDRTEIQARRFYSQRNTYLCGFTLFLTLIVSRTYSLVFELLNVKDAIRAHEQTEKKDVLDLADKSQVAELKQKIKEQDELILNLKNKSKSLSDDYMELTGNSIKTDLNLKSKSDLKESDSKESDFASVQDEGSKNIKNRLRKT
ncbi:hypothetical protein B5S30_g1482 [[Candida] boidinii]|nr:hypothetical protein B5S30_g1482 [[Candida] boidinii]